MKKLNNLEDLFALSNDFSRKFILIGIGAEGGFISEKLKGAGYKIKCFADETKAGKNYFGISVKSPAEIEIEPEDVLVICIGSFTYLSESEILKKSIIKNLPLKGNEIYLWDKYEYCRNLFLNACRKNNINTDGETLKIKDLTLPNYLTMDKGISDSFAMESRDLILPEYFDEWSALQEGPYAKISNTTGGGILLDCGANVGIFSAVAASKGCKVYAFEPIANCLPILEKVADIYPNVEICQAALSDEIGFVEMTNSELLSDNRIVTGGDDKNTVKVKCDTVDNFIKEKDLKRLDYIKADIEGAERMMLKGAKNTLKTLCPTLSLCTYHYDDDPEVLEKIILETNPNYRVEHKYKKLCAMIKETLIK